MVVRPTDVLRTNDEDRAEIERLEAAIDAALKKGARTHYRGAPIAVSDSLLGGDQVIRDELVRRYQRAGWTVKHHADQRDGNFYTFEVERREDER